MFFIIRFIISWTIWLVFADKKRWREIFPVCFFASWLGLISDDIMHYFPYWDYFSADFHPLITWMFDDFDVYPVVTYLFIQWLPKEQSFRSMFPYWFVWTGIAITIEFIHISAGYMHHLNGWTYWHSYISDWILYWLHYQFYKIFILRRLSRGPN